MAEKKEFYGLVSGKTSNTFAEAVNKSMSDDSGMIVSTWHNIPDFQKAVGANAKEEVQGIKAILITDMAFDNDQTVDAKAFAFNFMQSMFKTKELYGLHIILFTKDADLHDLLTKRYEQDPESKYEGTKVLLNPQNYTVTAIKGVFNVPFNLLSYSDKKQRELDKMLEEAKEQENRRISNQGFLMLLGKQQSLEDSIAYLQRELNVVNRKLVEYAISIRNDDLEDIVNEVEFKIDETLSDKLKKL